MDGNKKGLVYKEEGLWHYYVDKQLIKPVQGLGIQPNGVVDVAAVLVGVAPIEPSVARSPVDFVQGGFDFAPPLANRLA